MFSPSTHMHSLDDMDMCSLKALEADGSPSRTLLKLIGDQGCILGELVEFLQIMGHTDALQCLKPPGTTVSVNIVKREFMSQQYNAASLYLLLTVLYSDIKSQL